MVRTSCGSEGFKNVKKSTPIAAQTAGISAAAVRWTIVLIVTRLLITYTVSVIVKDHFCVVIFYSEYNTL